MKRLILILSTLSLLACSSSDGQSSPQPSQSPSANPSSSQFQSDPTSSNESGGSSSSQEQSQGATSQEKTESSSQTSGGQASSSSASETISSEEISEFSSSQVTGESTIEDEPAMRIQKIDSLLSKEYDYGFFTITVSKEERSLTSTYEITKEGGNVYLLYEVERFTTLDIDNPYESGEKTTVQGEIHWENGNKMVVSGEDISTDVADFSLRSYAIGNANMSIVENEIGYCRATLDNAKAYLGLQEDALQFEITFQYDDARIESFDYHYVNSQGYTVYFAFESMS